MATQKESVDMYSALLIVPEVRVEVCLPMHYTGVYKCYQALGWVAGNVCISHRRTRELQQQDCFMKCFPCDKMMTPASFLHVNHRGFV